MMKLSDLEWSAILFSSGSTCVVVWQGLTSKCSTWVCPSTQVLHSSCCQVQNVSSFCHVTVTFVQFNLTCHITLVDVEYLSHQQTIVCDVQFVFTLFSKWTTFKRFIEGLNNTREEENIRTIILLFWR